MNATDPAALKAAVGSRAADLVESGMRLGLGTGSTANAFIEAVGRRRAAGEITDVVGVATSIASAHLAEQVGIPVEGLDDRPLDLAVDGADEIGPGLDLIKGLGGAHLREKIVASRAERFVVIGDQSKLVTGIGTRAPVPLEAAAFGIASTIAQVGELGNAVLRVRDAKPQITDNDNLIIDLWAGEIANPAGFDVELLQIPGVLATGLFVGMAERALVAMAGEILDLDRGFGGSSVESST